MVIAGCKNVENIEVKIKDKRGILEYGELPINITSEEEELLTAEFTVEATNFDINHPQCDCKEIKYGVFECKEKFIVTGKDWKLAK